MDHRNRRTLTRLLSLNLILLAITLVWHGRQEPAGVPLAVAKGQHLYDMSVVPAVALNQILLQNVALADAGLAALLAEPAGSGRTYDFLQATRMGYGEAQPWREAGCRDYNCAHVTFYHYSDSAAVEAIVNLDSNQVVGYWSDGMARPAGSRFILPRVMAVAANDAAVQAVLGDIGAGDPLMAPMSGWLADSSCRDEWCVDLTFHDPQGSGRIFHVFVNVEREEVVRTFYTRGRQELPVARPVAQRNAFENGCHEQYGWNVCWEMTAHDGLLFRDATFDDRAIFSSAKIGQIEAWYPSWPGGYRDEIGFAASVPPFGGTDINDLGDGFEVRQLFTEFTRWPNCICCYRYEEALRFFIDGSVEFHFDSHGPGCDDISIYRPFWRIDLHLDGPETEVWQWQSSQWLEVTTETELYPLVEDLSPDGDILATFNDNLHYRWRMLPTDPLGLDEGYLFLLQRQEGEGDGPILTGPGDTFIPPRQWLDGDPVSGQDVVLWFVPLLKTKKSEPFWCMPDPEPGLNQCAAVLRAEPGEELHQPTADELAARPLAPTVAPTAVAVTPQATATPRPIGGEDAETVILNAGCGSCHHIGALGERGKVGPDLSNIGSVAGQRVAGMTAAEYLYQSIIEPNVYIAPECPNGPCLANIMPRDYETRLTPEQIEMIVAYLLKQTGEIAPTPAPIGAGAVEIEATAAPKAFPAPKRSPGLPSSSPALAVQILLLSLVFLLTLFRLLKTSGED